MRFHAIALVAWSGLAACGFDLGTDLSPPVSDAAPDGDPIDSAVDAPATIDVAAPAVPMIVQQQARYAGSGSPLDLALTANPASGNTLVMIGAANQGNLSGVTGGGVTTWLRAARSATNANVEIWFGVTDGSQATVSISRTGNTGPIWLAISEWSGLGASVALDQAIASDGTSGTASAGTIATTSARDLLIFAAADENSATFGAPSPGSWTGFATIGGGSIRQAAWYQLTSATGTYGPQVTTSGAIWDAALVALRVAP